MEYGRQTFFHGYTTWYLRAVIWIVQVAVAGFVLEFALGRVGYQLATVLGTLLLFRQFHHHVRQETAD